MAQHKTKQQLLWEFLQSEGKQEPEKEEEEDES